MHYVVHTASLIDEGLLTPDQGEIIRARSREAMVALAINTVLCAGILAAALGFVFWLADAFAVSITGGLFLAIGAAILLRGATLYRMFGTASSLIGAVMLSAGASIEMMSKLDEIVSGPLMAGLGATIAWLAYLAFRKGPDTARFVSGSVLLIGVIMHLAGAGLTMEALGAGDIMVALGMFYAAAVIAGVGALLDVRLITALAIVPFAEMLNTSTGYFHASYFFYSKETTLSILQMSALIAACLWVAHRFADRVGRHAGMLAIMAFIVGNLCFLVGSLWGDVIGESWWRTDYYAQHGYDYEAYRVASEAFRAGTLEISEHVYSVVWALLLVICAGWAAHKNQRGLFNAAITFGAIHAYTQAFESFSDEPLAYVIGGLAAIPIAWGMWRLDARFRAR